MELGFTSFVFLWPVYDTAVVKIIYQKTDLHWKLHNSQKTVCAVYCMSFTILILTVTVC